MTTRGEAALAQTGMSAITLRVGAVAEGGSITLLVE